MGNRRQKISSSHVTEITLDSGMDGGSKSRSPYKNKNRIKKGSGKDDKNPIFVETTNGTCQLCKRSTTQEQTS